MSKNKEKYFFSIESLPTSKKPIEIVPLVIAELVRNFRTKQFTQADKTVANQHLAQYFSSS